MIFSLLKERFALATATGIVINNIKKVINSGIDGMNLHERRNFKIFITVNNFESPSLNSWGKYRNQSFEYKSINFFTDICTLF